jgi:hypothetical protein
MIVIIVLFIIIRGGISHFNSSNFPYMCPTKHKIKKKWLIKASYKFLKYNKEILK